MEKKEDIYIHEDRYNLIQILPNNENFDIPEDEMIEISNFQKFKNLSLESKKINIEDLKKIMKQYNSYEHKNIYMGYSTQYKIKENNIAYIYDRIVIVFENNNIGILTNVWLDAIASSSEITATNLFSFLHYIGKMYNLILTDYESGYAVSLSSIDSIREYFKEVFDLV